MLEKEPSIYTVTDYRCTQIVQDPAACPITTLQLDTRACEIVQHMQPPAGSQRKCFQGSHRWRDR